MVNMPLALEIAVRRAGLEIMYNSSDVYTPPLNSFFDQLRCINTTINPQQVRMSLPHINPFSNTI